MWTRLIMAGLVLTAISGAFGWTYYEGRRSGVLEVELRVREAVEKERIRVEKVNEAAAQDAEKRIAELEELSNDLEFQLEGLSLAADSDPNTGHLALSRMLRIDEIRNRQNSIQ